MQINNIKDLSLCLRLRRKKLQLTQKAVGDLVGLGQKTISSIETNAQNTKVDTLFKILSALQLNFEIKMGEEKTLWSEEW